MQSSRFISMTAICTIMLLSKSIIAGTAGDTALVSSHWNGGGNLQVVEPFFQNNPAFYFLSARRVAAGDANFTVTDYPIPKGCIA